MENPKQQGKSADILLVAHGHILRAFAMRWIGRELTDGVALLLEGSSITHMSLFLSQHRYCVKNLAVYLQYYS